MKTNESDLLYKAEEAEPRAEARLTKGTWELVADLRCVGIKDPRVLSLQSILILQ